jgi:hypothetical protein
MPTSAQPEPFVPVTPSTEPPLLSGSSITWSNGLLHHRAEPVRIQPREAIRTGVIVASAVALAFILLLAAGITLSFQ